MSAYRDRDYIQDIKGDIFQVIGSIHPKQGTIALRKYQKVKAEQDIAVYKSLIPGNDPISQVKNHTLQYWIQKETNDHFIRVLPNYSSKSAEENMDQHDYTSFSSIFQMDLLMIPPAKILHHWNPQERMQDLIKNERNLSKLDSLERQTLDVIYNLKEIYGINLDQVGLTGSMLWNSHHERSDIDLMLYGKENLQKIMNGPKLKGMETYVEKSQLVEEDPIEDKIIQIPKGLRGYLKVELMPLAEKMEIKTGLPFGECFSYLFEKKYLFFHNNRKVSITFAPTLSELIFSPLYILDSQFINVPLSGPLIVSAEIVDDEWGSFYPGVFKIACEDIMGDLNLPCKKEDITRLMIWEHELVGYYKKSDKVVIKGQLQLCKNVPKFQGTETHTTYQILVGGRETFGKEYIRKG